MKVKNMMMVGASLLVSSQFAIAAVGSYEENFIITVKNNTPVAMTILLAAADAATNFQGQPNAVGDHVSIASGDERTISFSVDGFFKAWKLSLQACETENPGLKSSANKLSCSDLSKSAICSFSARGVGNEGIYSARPAGIYTCSASNSTGDKVTFNIG